ncbi:MAG: hypothetical protein IJI37_04320, partial [Opitutales bacterium]|nr:hypothetical protein [Opitutales bacterium]
ITGSMLGLARELRASMDEVDPSIPCSIGTCDADIRYAKKIAEILAGKGNKPVVRINNARYAANNTTPRTFAKSMYKTAAQARDVEGCEIIAETDALPHCRYSTSARSLHANYCGYIFNGCRGAKHWITIISEFDPSMNAAYRKILAEHAKMYEALAENADAVVGAKGLATPLPSKPFYNMNPFTPGGYASFTTWAQTVCNTTGIPANFAKIGAAPAMFGRGLLRMFTDEEIRRQLAIGMVLTGPAAAELCKRGYGKYLGVDAALCEKPSGLEKISADPINAELAGKFMSAGVSGFARLKPNSPKTRVLAEFMRGKAAKDQTALSPSATYFENELGGKIAVFGSEQTLDHFMFYMRYPRKDFFLKIFNAVSPFSFWYPHDAEVFVQTGTQKDGREFVCVYNFGWDPLEEIELGFSREPKSVKILGADGKFADAKFAVSGGVLKVKRKLEPMYPVFLKIGF